MSENRLSRRGLLKGAAVSAVVMVAAACAPQVVKETVVVEKEVTKEIVKEVEKVVKETVIVEGTPQVVEKVVKEAVVVKEAREIFKGDLILWHPWGTGFEGGAYPFLKNSEDFPKLHPEVKFTNVFDATRDKYLAAIAAGNPPDLLLLGAYDIPVLGQRGALTVLDPLIERDNFDLTQFWPMAVDQCAWRDKTYAITHHPDVRVMFYDQVVMQEVGLDANAEPKSWDEAYQWGMSMTKKDDKGNYERFGWVPTWTSDPWANHYMVANGVARLDESGRQATFHTAAAEEGLAYVVKCTEEICGGRDNVEQFQEIHATPDGKGAYWMFPYHRTGMLLYGNWLFAPIGIKDPKQPVNLGSLPGGPAAPNTRHVFHGGTMVSIPQKAKHWELGWEFLKYMSSQDYGNGVRFVQMCGDDISGNIKESTSADAMKYPGRPKMIELFKKANSPAYLKSPISYEWSDEMYRMQDRILLKEQTIPEALAASQKLIQKALDEFWASA